MPAQRTWDYQYGPGNIAFTDDMRRLVQLNASISVATNLDFEILGTNAANVGATFSNSGGQTFTTAGADADQLILVPHLDTAQSAIAVAAQFNSSNSPYFEAWIRTGASIANTIIWGGIKKTSTQAVTTDTDSLFVRYSSADHANWQMNASVSNVDFTTNTGIAVAASTLYHITIAVDSNRNWTCSVNNNDFSGIAKTFGNAPALTASVNLIPYIGVMANGAAAAKAIDILRVQYGRAVA